MSEEQAVAVESKASPEQQKAAEAIGWIPPTRFKGDAERFVDADEYIKRGETVLPIVKEHNKRLERELLDIRTEHTKTAAALKKATELLETMEERHSVETQKAVEGARKQLKSQLAAASEAGDHEAVAELTDQMTQLREAEKEAKAPPKKEAAVEAPPIDPEMLAWNKENPWFGTDRRKTSLALGIAQELREGGETAKGRAFYEMVRAEVEKTFAPAAPPADKVEGGRGSGGAGGGAKKGYAALPADAKAQCDADGRRFIGPNKKYKTQAEQRAGWAELYFSQE